MEKNSRSRKKKRSNLSQVEKRIGIDLMGSDSSPHVLFEAVEQANREFAAQCSFVVIATHSVVKELQEHGSGGIEFYPVSDAITMGDEPVVAVSRKKGSSLVVGLRLLKKGYIDAFVTAGNTGALIAGSTLQLPRLPGVKRPALLALLPSMNRTLAVLDIGGSVACKPFHLVQFAYLGAAYQRCIEGIETPVVALLNIGIESQKGTSSVRQAYQILCQHEERSQEKPLFRFVGNSEGRDFFREGIDVLVTDGFTGNVFLKTAEGISSFVFDYLRNAIVAPVSEEMQTVMNDMRRYFSYAEYPGAIVCGVEGLVVKCHGSSSPQAMLSGVRGAVRLLEKNVIVKLKEELIPYQHMTWARNVSQCS